MENDEILIIGTGAMACLFATRIAPYSGVTMLGSWQEGVEALAEHGVRLTSLDGEQAGFQVHATSDESECKGHRTALVLVKSWQTARAARQLRSCLAPDGVALTLQNGLGNLEILQGALGRERCALGVTTLGATLIGPGHVRDGGGTTTHVVAHPGLEPLLDLLRKAGMKVEVVQDLDGVLWGKLVINTGINPITALLEIPNGELLTRPDAQAMMIATAQESAAIAAARGIELPYTDPGEHIVQVARDSTDNFSSMYQDILRGAPTEIHAICGAVVEEAERYGVPAPLNWALLRLISAKATAAE
jgi:2-dehydropantoate 2-reductase